MVAPDLYRRTYKSTFGNLLQVDNPNTVALEGGGITGAGVDETLRDVYDGRGGAVEAVQFALKCARIGGALYPVLTADGTTDNAAALLAWMNVAGAGGVLIVARPGTYVLSTIVWPHKIKLVSGPGVQWLIKAGHTDHMNWLASGCEIEGGEWNGNKDNISSTLRLFYANNRHDVHFEGCLFTEGKAHALHFDDGQRNNVDRCMFVDFDDTPCQFYAKTAANVESCHVRDCFFDRSMNSAPLGGLVKFSYSTGGTIDRCTIESCDGHMPVSTLGTDVVLYEFWSPGEGCAILSCQGHGGGITCSIANGQDHGRICDNYAFKPSGTAFELADGDYGLIEGNTCHGDNYTLCGCSIDGTNLGAVGCIARGNTIRDCVERGILVWAGADDFCVGGNNIRHVSNQDGAIHVEGSDDGEISGNKCQGGGTGNAGILIRNASGIGVTGNTCPGFTHKLQVIANDATVNHINVVGLSGGAAGGIQFLVQGTGAFGNNCKLDQVDWFPYGSILGVKVTMMTESLDTWIIADGYITGGSPEGVVSAGIGSKLRSDNGNIYRKSSAGGNTGWTAM